MNHAPVITSTPGITANVGQLYSYIITATDSDGDTLSYGLHIMPYNMSISGNVISWTPTSSQTGDHTVEVAVTDVVNDAAIQTFTITVGTSGKITPTINWATPAAITYGTPFPPRN